MKYASLAFTWLVGLLFVLVGVGLFMESAAAAGCLFVAAALVLPPVRNYVHGKTDKILPAGVRLFFLLVLFGAAGVFVGIAENARAQRLDAQQAAERSRKAAVLRQQNIDYFNANHDKIMASIKSALSQKDYESVISQSNRYLASGNRELQDVNTHANTEMTLAELARVPADDYEKNKSIYQQLLTLNPTSTLYKTKVDLFTAKIEEQKQQRTAAEARKKRIEAQFSAWDGSHRNLERFIKESMNDPDSYKHVKTIYWDDGDYLVVRTTFRGTNAFGGVVTNSVTAKVGLDGKVLQILGQT